MMKLLVFLSWVSGLIMFSTSAFSEPAKKTWGNYGGSRIEILFPKDKTEIGVVLVPNEKGVYQESDRAVMNQVGTLEQPFWKGAVTGGSGQVFDFDVEKDGKEWKASLSTAGGGTVTYICQPGFKQAQVVCFETSYTHI
jgi:hypothetical protein